MKYDIPNLFKDEDIFPSQKNRYKKSNQKIKNNEDGVNPKITSFFQKIVGLKSYLMKSYKKIKSEKLKEKEEKQSKERNKDLISKNQGERLKIIEEKNKSSLIFIFNYILSILFLSFTLISIFIQKTQDKSFFSRFPLEKKISEVPFPNFVNTHKEIMEDFLKRYEFAFEINNKIMKKVEQIDLDLIPIGSFRVSISRTKNKICEDIDKILFDDYDDNCYEALYIPNKNATSNDLFNSNADSIFPEKTYEIIDLYSNELINVNSIEFIKTLHKKYNGLNKNSYFTDEVSIFIIFLFHVICFMFLFNKFSIKK